MTCFLHWGNDLRSSKCCHPLQDVDVTVQKPHNAWLEFFRSLTRVTLTRLLLAVTTTLLNACAQIHTPNAGLSANNVLMESWQMSGKIGIKTPEDRVNAAITWQQIARHYDLSLSGLFGQGMTRISGDDQQLRLERHTGEAIQDHPESVLQEHLGWSFPLDHFRYWAQGSLAPKVPAEHVLTNEFGLITGFSQADWEVRLSRHQQSELLSRPLPAKIIAKRRGITITLIVKKWSPITAPKAST